ncbi:MAG: hypothetical protein GTO63_10795, partial [Anaerolineae bacterium]|nr:hypothetical protein [Anaerolineae bacterium]NIQ78360.1 hypothetical protein [Anaerolineae bacterium]
ILSLLAVMTSGPLGAGLLQGGAVPAGLSGWEGIVEILLIPWVTFIFLALGMVLLIAELMTIHTWGATGTVGTACLGVLFAAYLSAGVATWVGV